MKRSALLIAATLALIVLITVIVFMQSRGKNESDRPQLRVAIAPYQDLAMLVNIEPLGLEEKYDLDVELVTMAWEDILPAVASYGRTVDIGFGSLVEYLTKQHKLNDGVADPIVFVQPLYVYKGGGFVALDSAIPLLDALALQDVSQVEEFLKLRFGAQKQSLYEMMLFTIARRAGVAPDSLNVTHISMNDGVLALQSGSLDVTSAGLTQLNEVRRRGGRLVISMEDTGFADIVGFICLQSTLDERKEEIEDIIRAWFDCVAHVMSDLEGNSEHSLAYLRQNAATQYSFEEYSAALSQEYLPRSLEQLRESVLQAGAKYDLARVSQEISAYLLDNDLAPTSPQAPNPLLRGE